MPRHLHFTKYFIASMALHALAVLGVLMIKPTAPELPLILPVNIINLPQEILKRLPPVRRPLPPPPVQERFVPEKPLSPGEVPLPKKFGTSDEVKLPKTEPRSGMPEGAGQDSGKTGVLPRPQTGPLPFLSQNEIDELARKAVPEHKFRDDVLQQETEAYRAIEYERWAFVKLNSILRYPELAKISGLQGFVLSRFEILRDGSLGSIDILKSSGYKILDDEVVRHIKESAPFQPLPEDWKVDRHLVEMITIFYFGQIYYR